MMTRPPAGVPAFRFNASLRELDRILGLAAIGYAVVLTILFIAGTLPRHRAEASWYIAAAVLLPVCGATLRPPPPKSGTAADLLFTNSRLRGVPLGILLLVASALYVPSLTIGYLSDDYVLIDRARRGVLTMAGNEMFRPAPMVVWWAYSRLPLASAVPLHVLNAFIHGTNAWLMYIIARRLRLPEGIALLAAASFAVSAANVEAVTWIASLFDLAMTLGTLLFILGCIDQRPGLAILGIVLAVFAKETGIVAPLLGLGFAWHLRSSLRLPVVCLVAVAAFTVLRLAVLPPSTEFVQPPSGYIAKELVSRVFGAMALPWTEAEIKMASPRIVFPLVAVVFALVVATVRRFTSPLLMVTLLGLGWVVVSVLPVYRYFYIAPTLENSRYLYLGTCGFVLAFGSMLATAWDRAMLRRGLVSICLISIAINVAGTIGHERPWRRAAMLRDAVLISAQDVLARKDCATVQFRDLPDTIDGAFVFRNGFVEALQWQGIDARRIVLQHPQCIYRWNGAEFIRSTADARM